MYNQKPAKNLFWDLGNTLISMNTLSFARKLGLFDLCVYSLDHRAVSTKIFNKALDLLAQLDVASTQPCKATAQGRPLPDVVCQWLTGNIKTAQVRSFLDKPFIDRYPHNFFANNREARLVEKFLKTLADPQALTSTLKVIKAGKVLLQECAEQYDYDGDQRHRLFVLSNWDPYSLNLMIDDLRLKEVFNYFHKQNLIISGDIGLVKPEDDLYSYVLTRYKLNPSDCILIDDQIENIEGAQKHGMNGILLKDRNYKEVRNILRVYDVI